MTCSRAALDLSNAALLGYCTLFAFWSNQALKNGSGRGGRSTSCRFRQPRRDTGEKRQEKELEGGNESYAAAQQGTSERFPGGVADRKKARRQSILTRESMDNKLGAGADTAPLALPDVHSSSLSRPRKTVERRDKKSSNTAAHVVESGGDLVRHARLSRPGRCRVPPLR